MLSKVQRFETSLCMDATVLLRVTYPIGRSLSNSVCKSFYEDEHRKRVVGSRSYFSHLASDCWSDPNLTSFLAPNAHSMVRDMNGRLVLRNHLLAFRVIEGKHDGKNLGRIIFEILKEAVVLEKVSASAQQQKVTLTVALDW